MSEEKQSGFMQELDRWVEDNVFRPLLGTAPDLAGPSAMELQVMKAIRTKVRESYRNGQQAGPHAFRESVTRIAEEKQPDFFEELDRWVESRVEELAGDIDEEELCREGLEKFKNAIREKVLESYRSGQKAGPVAFSERGGRG